MPGWQMQGMFRRGWSRGDFLERRQLKLNLKLATWKREKDHSDPSVDVSEDLEVRGKEGTELWFYHRDEAGEDSLGGHWAPGGDVQKMAGNGRQRPIGQRQRKP